MQIHHITSLDVTGSFSIRMADALNSAVPAIGQFASIVSWLVSTSSGKVHGHERKAGPQRGVDPHRCHDGSPARGDLDLLAHHDPEVLGVLRTELDILSAPQRRGETAALHPGVVRVEPPPGGEPDRTSSSVRSTGGSCWTIPNGASRPRSAGSEAPQPAVQIGGFEPPMSGQGHWMPWCSARRSYVIP